MTSSERDVQVGEQANRILKDGEAAAAHARFVELQLRWRRVRNLAAALRRLGRRFARVTVALFGAEMMVALAPRDDYP